MKKITPSRVEVTRAHALQQQLHEMNEIRAGIAAEGATPAELATMDAAIQHLTELVMDATIAATPAEQQRTPSTRLRRMYEAGASPLKIRQQHARSLRWQSRTLARAARARAAATPRPVARPVATGHARARRSTGRRAARVASGSDGPSSGDADPPGAAPAPASADHSPQLIQTLRFAAQHGAVVVYRGLPWRVRIDGTAIELIPAPDALDALAEAQS